MSPAHASICAGRIGAGRAVGHIEPMDEDLMALERCTGKIGDQQEDGSLRLKNEGTSSPLVFTLSSEKH